MSLNFGFSHERVIHNSGTLLCIHPILLSQLLGPTSENQTFPCKHFSRICTLIYTLQEKQQFEFDTMSPQESPRAMLQKPLGSTQTEIRDSRRSNQEKAENTSDLHPLLAMGIRVFLALTQCHTKVQQWLHCGRENSLKTKFSLLWRYSYLGRCNSRYIHVNPR